MKKLIFHFISILIFENIISSPNCKEGINLCQSCHPITKLCLKCEKDIYTPDNNGGCEYSKTCYEKKNHCLKCNDDKDLCEKCEEDYYPDENGGCSFVNNCEISWNGRCLKCRKDFILIGLDEEENDLPYYEIKICKSLNSEDLKHCEEINIENGLCNKCKIGYYLNEGDKKCILTQNCYESAFGICKRCISGYYLFRDDRKCYKEKGILDGCKESYNNITCNICDEDYYFDEKGICCSINFCEEKGDYYPCLKCINGYILSISKDSCTQEKNCLNGDKELGTCTLCTYQYYLDINDGKCKSNREDNDFKYCETADEACLTCSFGYHIGKDNKCSNSRHCSESNLGTCLICEDNFYLGLDNICNVEHCIYSNEDKGICIECEKNYYYNRKGNNCKIAENNFENCRIGVEDENCKICHNDFYLNKKDHLCHTNLEIGPFYKCAYSDSEGEKCSKCLAKYYLGNIDKLCTTMEGCDISENENKCIQCNPHYSLNLKDNRCYQNGIIKKENDKFYYRCNRTNIEGTQCEICLEGFVLNENGLCFEVEHCTKMEEGVCKECQIGEDGIYCLNNIFGCIKTSTKHCVECNNILDFDSCDKCEEGYVVGPFHECQLPEE